MLFESTYSGKTNKLYCAQYDRQKQRVSVSLMVPAEKAYQKYLSLMVPAGKAYEKYLQ